MALLSDVQEYCNTSDDLSTYIRAAEEYLINLGIPVAEFSPLYGMAVKMLVSWWYDKRIPAAETGTAPQPYGLNGIILQLQIVEEASG